MYSFTDWFSCFHLKITWTKYVLVTKQTGKFEVHLYRKYLLVKLEYWSSVVQNVFGGYITNWNMRIHVFFYVMLCHWVRSLWHFKGPLGCLPFTALEPFTLWHSVPFHKMWILNHTTMKTFNVRWCQKCKVKTSVRQ